MNPFAMFMMALAADAINEKQADSKRKKLIKQQKKKASEGTQELVDTSLDTAQEVYGGDRTNRSEQKAVDLSANMTDLMGESEEPYKGDTRYEGEAAKRTAQRTKEAIDMKRLLSQYGAIGGTMRDEGLRKMEGANQAAGVGRGMNYDYDRFIEDYNKVKPNAGISAISSLMKGYAMGGMYGG